MTIIALAHAHRPETAELASTYHNETTPRLHVNKAVTLETVMKISQISGKKLMLWHDPCSPT